MNLKLQLKVLSFLQFCLWGSWLTTLGSYMFVTLKFDGASIGAVYSSLGIAAVFMPTLLGSWLTNGSVRNGCTPFVTWSAQQRCSPQRKSPRQAPCSL